MHTHKLLPDLPPDARRELATSIAKFSYGADAPVTMSRVADGSVIVADDASVAAAAKELAARTSGPIARFIDGRVTKNSRNESLERLLMANRLIDEAGFDL